METGLDMAKGDKSSESKGNVDRGRAHGMDTRSHMQPLAVTQTRLNLAEEDRGGRGDDDKKEYRLRLT